MYDTRFQEQLPDLLAADLRVFHRMVQHADSNPVTRVNIYTTLEQETHDRKLTIPTCNAER